MTKEILFAVSTADIINALVARATSCDDRRLTEYRFGKNASTYTIGSFYVLSEEFKKETGLDIPGYELFHIFKGDNTERNAYVLSIKQLTNEG